MSLLVMLNATEMTDVACKR